MINEQTELVDELTMQLTQAQIELEMTAVFLKYNEANNIVKSHIIMGGGMGLIPVALVDIIVLSANQQMMIKHLCQLYEVDFDAHRSKLLVLSLLTGATPALAVIGLSSLFKFIPGIGSLGGSAGVVLSSGAITYATGQTVIKHFSAGGTLDDFESFYFSSFFKKQLKKGKQLVRNMKPKAVADKVA